jgi:hypothetical protein
MVFKSILKETSKLELSLHVRLDFVSKTCKGCTRISLVIDHTDIVVYVSRFACNVVPVVLRHMTLKLKTLTIPS